MFLWRAREGTSALAVEFFPRAGEKRLFLLLGSPFVHCISSYRSHLAELTWVLVQKLLLLPGRA